MLGARLICLICIGLLGFAPVFAQVPDHLLWDTLLKKHVTETGHVNYQGFIADSVDLNRYLASLQSGLGSAEIATVNAQKAFWINAYNAFTVQLVMRNYPLGSIKDIGAKVQIPFVNTPWDIPFIQIAGETLDLNKIEHKKLCEGFGDPRIHFAIVCASASCPKLQNHAFLPATLEAQLDQAAREFLADPQRNQLHGNTAKLSKIFLWYKGDFSQDQSRIDFINRYAEKPLKPNCKLKFLDYDWSLNE
jgi:hypothetical protein